MSVYGNMCVRVCVEDGKVAAGGGGLPPEAAQNDTVLVGRGGGDTNWQHRTGHRLRP